MNYERLYETAQEALRLACISVHGGNEPDGMGLYNLMMKDPELYMRASDNYLWHDALPALVIYAMAKDELGKAKSGTAYGAFKRIIKRNADIRKDLAGVWKDADGRSCVCDGYLAVRLKKPVDGFESAPGMDMEKVFPKDSYFSDPVELALPTPGELKINRKKLTSGKSVYDFGDDLPMVDASFLKDVMDCLPGAKAITENHATHKMIYFTSENGDAILLPVRKNVA